MRLDDCLDVLVRRKPGSVPRSYSARRRNLGAGPWLDTLEGIDHICEREREQDPKAHPLEADPRRVIDEVISDHEQAA